MKPLTLFLLLVATLLLQAENPKLWPGQPFRLLPVFPQTEPWTAALEKRTVREFIRLGDDALRQSHALPSRDDYLEFFRSGTRNTYEKAYLDYREAISYLAMAAAVSGKKTYLPAMERMVVDLCNYPSWVLPAHDAGKQNLNGKHCTIDLVSSRVGWNLTLIRQTFDTQLKAETLNLIDREVTRRIIRPFLRMLDGKQNPYWLHSKNNWQIVCLCNVAGATLGAEIPDQTRARILTQAVRLSEKYLQGFGEDGYCSEGMSYWNYGFSHYLTFAAIIRRSSANQLNLMKRPAAIKAAQFPERIRLSDNLIPAFADSAVNLVLPVQFLAMRDRLLRQNKGYAHQLKIYPKWTDLGQMAAVLALPEPIAPEQDKQETDSFSAFPMAGVYVMRPEQHAPGRLALALKGGSNHEFHNHNDVGSFVLALDQNVPMLVDPGIEHYTAKTFGPKRYESSLMNSFGHSVPRINGQLQTEGQHTDAILLKQINQKEHDIIQFDILPAYKNLKQARKMVRTWHYDRRGDGTVTLTDEISLAEPGEIESALITFGTWKQTADDALVIAYRNKKLLVRIDTDKQPFKLSEAVIHEPIRWKEKPRRIAVTLEKKASQTTIRMTFIPLNSTRKDRTDKTKL